MPPDPVAPRPLRVPPDLLAGTDAAYPITEGTHMPDDTPTALLARRYRRWLLAYPRAYRRERGPEILATLLEAAEPGQDRPPAREAWQLLRHGLGRRVADAGIRGFVVAVFAAALGALSGIALGSWLCWQQVGPMTPDKATAARVAATVLPMDAEDPSYYGQHTFWNPYSENTLHGGTGVRAGTVEFSGKVPRKADYRQLGSAVTRWMRAHGWHDVRYTITRFAPHTMPAAEITITGKRDGYLASVLIDPYDGANATSVELDVMWAEPPGHITATVAGGVFGAVLGVLVALFTSSRMRRRPRHLQRMYLGLCVATLLMLTPACLGNIPTASGSLLANTNRNHPGPSVFWGGFVIYGAEPLAILSLVPILAVLIVCLWPRTETTRTAALA